MCAYGQGQAEGNDDGRISQNRIACSCSIIAFIHTAIKQKHCRGGGGGGIVHGGRRISYETVLTIISAAATKWLG